MFIGLFVLCAVGWQGPKYLTLPVLFEEYRMGIQSTGFSDMGTGLLLYQSAL
jgi:hypothetical protein